MAAVAAGVVVVSARDADGFRGLTATSFTSASLEPPLVLVCLDRLSRTRDAVAAGGAFNVSVFERFAGRAPLVDPAWRAVPHELGTNGLPVVAGCVAWFECRLRALHPAGDHDLVIGEVTGAGRRGGDPLVLWDRAFWGLA